MGKRVCAEPGCPELTDAPAPRCTQHTRQRDAARGRRQARGYDAAHDRLRASWQRKLDRGALINCWRCGDPIDPKAWHLGHDDHDRGVYRGPECVGCNTGTSGRP